MAQSLRLPYAEFYITNVCNLTCEGCNRFNSFKFKGWQAWDDHKETYKRWSQELYLETVSIMGGEPLLNPDFYKWVQGIRELWPSTKIMVASNGFFLDKNHEFYDYLMADRKLSINVSLHNKAHKKDITQKIENFLKPPFRYDFDNTPYRESLVITDSNNISIKVFYNWWFHQGAVITDAETGKYTLHQSDPVKAHDICHSKTCHHFDHGRLYKCGPAALFPEFDRQFKLELSEQDRALMSSVKSIGIDSTREEKENFIAGINDPIPQCKFCPSSYHGKQIFAEEKKIVFRRKKQQELEHD